MDGASTAALRFAVGCVAVAVPVRLLAYGWAWELYVDPPFHFAWVPWARVPPEPVFIGLIALLIPLGAAVAVGFRTRLAIGLYLTLFVGLELLDKAYYLNHYVLLTLLLGILWVEPARGAGSWDGRRGDLDPTVPAAIPALLRITVGSVYVWAGLCKLNADWLLRGEPLHTWLKARVDLPLVGPVLALPETALAMSWGGAAYDLLIPALLLHPRTRCFGYILVLGFHGVTGLLFPIGVFPWVMVAASTIFLPVGWPRRAPGPADRPTVLGWPAMLAWTVAVLALILVPARHLLLPGDVDWGEQGARFAWRVLLNEKTGHVEFRVVERRTGATWVVLPTSELTPIQHEQMRTQPDLIRDYALHLAEQARADGRDVAVYADSWASLNGRPVQRLIDPTVDLTRVDPGSGAWIVPLGK